MPASSARLLTFLLAAALGAVLAVAPAARAATADEAVARLNAQRAAHGIPAGILADPDLSRGCALHNGYQRQNGGQLTHDESEGQPGYTPEGDRAAGTSVLASGSNWNGENPWETAPIHLAQLLAPRLDRMGVDDSGGFVCATTLASRERPAPPSVVVHSYPGGGTTHRASEVASEGPYTPGERVGIPAGTRTGPYLYVLIDGLFDVFERARITSASVTGPDGPVAVRTVDNHTSGLEGFLPTGGMVIPEAPLAPGASYQVQVTATLEDGTPVSHAWTFKTAAAPPPPVVGDPGGEGPFDEDPELEDPSDRDPVIDDPPEAGPGADTRLRVGRPRARGAVVRFPIRAGSALIGLRAIVSGRMAFRPCRTCRRRFVRIRRSRVRLARRGVVTVRRPNRTARIKLLVRSPFARHRGLLVPARRASRSFAP